MIILKILIALLNVIYFFFKIFPINDKKVFFLSRQSNKPSVDFNYLIKEFEKREYKVVCITKRMEKRLSQILFKMPLVIFQQLYHLATSKYCIVDTYNITVSVLKHKKNLKIIQIWHSMGAIKKFGYDALNTPKKIKIASTMKMHKNYNIVLTGSKAMTPYFSSAFGVDKDKCVTLGLPRIDYLIETENKNKEKIYKKYPSFKKKKTILYVPTFRDDHHYKINELVNIIDYKKYELIIKLHPNTKLEEPLSNKVKVCDEFNSLELISVADYVITDYSGISIEASVLNKPVYLYVYDYEAYSKNPGLNIDLFNELKGYVFNDANSLYTKLNNTTYDKEVIKSYRSKYIASDKNVTKQIVDLIVTES